MEGSAGAAHSNEHHGLGETLKHALVDKPAEVIHHLEEARAQQVRQCRMACNALLPVPTCSLSRDCLQAIHDQGRPSSVNAASCLLSDSVVPSACGGSMGTMRHYGCLHVCRHQCGNMCAVCGAACRLATSSRSAWLRCWQLRSGWRWVVLHCTPATAIAASAARGLLITPN
jgi:hypothetical protein